MSTKFGRVAALCALLGPGPWRAAVAVTIQASAQGTVAGVNGQDTQGPAAAGSLLAEQSFAGGTRIDGTGSAAALAAQNDAGVEAVLVDGAYTDGSTNVLAAETHWQASAVNATDHKVLFSYNFFVTPARLEIFDTTPLTNSATTASWRIEVRANGNLVFESDATLTGGAGAHTLVHHGVDFGARPFTNATAHTFGYLFGRYDASLVLGSFGPGETINVETILTASAQSLASGRGARAELGDPLDLGSDPGLSGFLFESDAVGVASASWGAVKALFR